MAHELRSDDVAQEQEDSLLIEAVSLLVQRHRETETWLAEQISQADHRAAATERRYADLEARLTGIEDQLDRLARELEPRFDPADNRLARLREQVEDLKSDGDARAVRPVVLSPSAVPTAAAPSTFAPAPQPVVASVPPPIAPAVVTAPPNAVPPAAVATPVAVSTGQRESVWDALGPRPQDRAGLVLIGLGLLAVFFAILTQLRVG